MIPTARNESLVSLFEFRLATEPRGQAPRDDVEGDVAVGGGRVVRVRAVGDRRRPRAESVDPEAGG